LGLLSVTTDLRVDQAGLAEDPAEIRKNFFWGGQSHRRRCPAEDHHSQYPVTQYSDCQRSSRLRTPAHTLRGGLEMPQPVGISPAQPCTRPGVLYTPRRPCKKKDVLGSFRLASATLSTNRTVTYHLAVWKRSKGSKSRDPATIDAIFPKCCLDHHTGMAQRICWTLFSYRMWCCNPLLFATWDTMGLFLPGHQKAAFLRSISRGCRMIHWKASCFSVALMNEESLVNGTGVLRQLTS
jgi:hypothetical protein